ncbi:hypothetical protein VTN02DRAFT_472 [Thermoascus thermophilus]
MFTKLTLLPLLPTIIATAAATPLLGGSGGNLITPVMPGSIPANHGDSGCYPYKEEECCMTAWICRCHTGVFYHFNGIAACQPPGAIIGGDVRDLRGVVQGFCC